MERCSTQYSVHFLMSPRCCVLSLAVTMICASICYAGVSCGEPVGPENGQTSKNGVLYEATALFSCGKGHMMLPPYVLKHCSAQGDWIPGIPPVCKGTA